MYSKRMPALFISLFALCSLFSQENIDFLGVIKLNDTTLISYKLSLQENNGNVSGFSITDLGGLHETKSLVAGFYDYEKKVFEFREKDIIYTKSKIDEYDFCFVHFKGKIRNINRRQNLKGSFKGLYSDGTECLSGDIDMMRLEKIIKKAETVDRKIQKLKRIDDEVKKRVSVQKTLDTLSMNVIKSNENLSVFIKDKVATLVIYDAGKEDGDKINLFVNNKLKLSNFVVTREKKILKIPLTSKQTTVKIKALNMGSIAPNTVRLEIENLQTTIDALTNLKYNEAAQITLIKG